MSSFTEDLYVRKIGVRKWEVTRSFDYHVGKEDSGEVVTIPKGFITDFASSPRITWVFFPPDGRYTQAAVLHDYLIKTKQYSRDKTNKIFLEAMEVLGVPMWKRLIMYWSVQVWTYVFWKKYTAMVILLLLLTSCASTSEHWVEKRVVKNKLGKPILIEGKKQIVEVDCIKQRGIIKAKHPTGAEGESKPYIEMPQMPDYRP